MKTKLFQIGLILLVIFGSTSCKKALENALSTEIPITGKSIVFEVDAATKSAEASATRAGETEEVLYEGDLKINIAAELKKQGFSFENIKSFLITQGTIEEAAPSGFDMKGFVGAKLYFENKTKLVAKAEKIEGNKVRFTIVNGELLDKLKEDNLHIILTGVRPNKKLKLRLVMDYKAKVSLIK